MTLEKNCCSMWHREIKGIFFIQYIFRCLNVLMIVFSAKNMGKNILFSSLNPKNNLSIICEDIPQKQNVWNGMFFYYFVLDL